MESKRVFHNLHKKTHLTFTEKSYNTSSKLIQGYKDEKNL